MDRDQERGTIASNVQTVLQSFRNVTASFNQETESPNDQPESSNLLELLPVFENEITRFKMWAGNLAAHQSGPASLDYRLREAPHLQEPVIYLLKDISESLQDIISLIPHGAHSWIQAKDSGGYKEAALSFRGSPDQGSEDDFTGSDLDDDEEGVSPETRLSTLCIDISEAIDCLLRLSVAIANPAPHERFRKLGAGLSEDVSYYEAHDIRYVRDKFPKIGEDLPKVLGKFITRRRQFFKYREAHHAKLAAGLDAIAAEGDTSRTEVIPKTVASSLPEHLKGAGVMDEDGRSNMGMSETSYATSAGFLMEGGDRQTEPPPLLKVPPPPVAAERGTFECPFCYRMISASTRGAWRRHVFGDLRPYTCLFSRCTESNTDFDRRHRWQLHVSQYHWRTWSCPFQCGGFSSAVELGHHIRHQHLPTATEEQLNTVITRGETSLPDDATNECPLCGYTVSGLKSYIKHVGRHLEQLALFALPNIEDEGLEDDVESDEQNDVASELVARSADADSSDASSKAPSQLQQHDIYESGEEASAPSGGPEAQPTQTTVDSNAGTMAPYAYVEDVPEDQFGWAEYEVSSDDESPKGPPPEAPSPPSASPETHVDVFEFLVGTGQTPNASNMKLDADSLVRYEPKEKNDDYAFMDDDDNEPAVEYGSAPVPAAEFVTPAPKSERRKSRTSTEKKDKKRKRLNVDAPGDPVMADVPPFLHTGLTGGLNRMMRPASPPSPDYSCGDALGGDAPEAST